jgi:hypothetical protein
MTASTIGRECYFPVSDEGRASKKADRHHSTGKAIWMVLKILEHLARYLELSDVLRGFLQGDLTRHVNNG